MSTRAQRSYTVQIDGDPQTPTAVVAAGSTLQVPIPPAAAQALMQTWPTSYASAADADADGALTNLTLLFGNLDPIETISGIQGRLKNLGYDPGAVDGTDGPNTQGSIKQFQGDKSLTVDGICGLNTTAALKQAYGM